MYKSDYKKQKEFEELILTGKIEDVIEYNIYNNSVNLRKNGFNGLYNLAIRGNVELFKELMSLIKYRIKKYDKFDIKKFIKLIFKHKNFDLLKEVINNDSNINFYFYAYIKFDKREELSRVLYSESIKKDCPFEIFEFILNNVKIYYNYNCYDTKNTIEFKIIEKIIKNSKMEIFEKKILEIISHKYFIEDYFIEYCLTKNKKNYVVKYLELLNNKKKIINLLSKIHNNSKTNLLKRFKNIHGIKLNKKEELEIIFYTKNKNVLKELIMKSSKEDKKSVLLDRISFISEENFNCFLENDKEVINELIDKDFNKLINDSIVYFNTHVIKYILKTTNLKKFDNNLFYNFSLIKDSFFFELMKDERFHYDNEFFGGLNLLIKCNHLKKLDYVLKIDRIRKGINTKIIKKLFKEKRIDTLKVVINNIKKEELENYESLHEEIRCFFKVKDF